MKTLDDGPQDPTTPELEVGDDFEVVEAEDFWRVSFNDTLARRILYQGYDSTRQMYGAGIGGEDTKLTIKAAIHYAQSLDVDEFVEITHNPNAPTRRDAVTMQTTPSGLTLYSASPNLLWSLQCLAMGNAASVNQGLGRIEEESREEDEDGLFVVHYKVASGKLLAMFDREGKDKDEIVHPLSIVIGLDPDELDDSLAG